MTQNKKIEILAKNLFQHTKHETGNFTLLLGAGASIPSGIKGWPEQCKEYCDQYGLYAEDEEYVETLKRFLKQQGKDKYIAYNTLKDNFYGKAPSYGYKHLATLVKNGIFKTIITTNFDDLLEQALLKIIPVSKIKIFVRGEVQDEYIAKYITSGISPTINIIKLHGDINSNIFNIQDEELRDISPALSDALRHRMSAGSVIVGSELSDINLQGLYINGDGINKYHVYVNPKCPTTSTQRLLGINTMDNPYQYIETDFDTFFTNLCKEIQIKEFKETVEERLSVEKDIFGKKEKGTNYVNASYLSTLADDLWRKIQRIYVKKNQSPDLFVFIDDPIAPGGMEMKRLLSESIKETYPKALIETIQIAGLGTRYHKRNVCSNIAYHEDSPNSIVVIDAISFSGNTMKLAIDKYKTTYPLSDVMGAVVFMGEQLKDNKEFNNIIYLQTTDRHEIYFPWGMTQATKRCERKLQTGDYDEKTKVIKIDKRKWGTIEVLEEERNCSVRILTIEANQKLSFQRHFERDELFVSLDENIGLEICAATLDECKNKRLNEIKEIKSLVLEKGDYILIPRGVWHRTKANRDRVRLLEIGYGIYDQENDIERFPEQE